MTTTSPPSRLRTLLVGPLPAPRDPGDLAYFVMRAARRTFWPTLAVMAGVMGVAVAIMAIGSSPDAVGWGTLLAFAAVPIALPVRFILARRLKPAAEALVWQAERDLRTWREIDGGDPPTSAAEGLERLAGRDDDRSTGLRCGYLHASGDTAAAQRLLDDWHPIEPADQAWRERIVSRWAFEHGVDDLAGAEAAAARIATEPERRAALAQVRLEGAYRLAVGSSDPLPMMSAARRELGRIERPALVLAKYHRPLWYRAGKAALWIAFGFGFLYAFWAVLVVILNALHVA